MFCAVCTKAISNDDSLLRLSCQHAFHWSCAYPIVRARDACPVCEPSARVNREERTAALQLGSDPDYEAALEASIQWSALLLYALCSHIVFSKKKVFRS